MKLKKTTPKLTPKQQLQQKILAEQGVQQDLAQNSDITFAKNFVKVDDSWIEISADNFSNLKIKDVFKNPYVIQLNIDDTQLYVCTFSNDAERLRRKHPDYRIVSLESVVGMFTPESNKVSVIADDFLKMLEIISIIPAKFIDLR